MVVRRIVAIILVLAGSAALTHTLMPQPDPGLVQAMVARTDLASGRALAAEDLRPMAYAAHLVPTGAVLDIGSLVGRSLSGSVGAGEIVTESRLVGAGLLTGQPPGARAVSVSVSDGGIIEVLSVGDRVDILTAGSSEPLATDVVVLRIQREHEPAGLLGTAGGEGGVIVAVDGPQSLAIASGVMEVSGGVTIALRAPNR